MSMEFSDMNQVGGGSAITALLAGSALNKDRDDGKTTLLAAIVFVIVFIIAIIAFAMMFKDRGYDHKNYGGTDVAAMLAPLIAAKSMDCNNGYKNGEIDKFEILQKLEHSEDRAEMRRVQEEQNRQTQSFMQLGFGLSGQINGHEKTDLENFAKLENQMGMMQMGLSQLLQKENNRDIVSSVVQQLAMGAPCYAKC